MRNSHFHASNINGSQPRIGSLLCLKNWCTLIPDHLVLQLHFSYQFTFRLILTRYEILFIRDKKNFIWARRISSCRYSWGILYGQYWGFALFPVNQEMYITAVNILHISKNTCEVLTELSNTVNTILYHPKSGTDYVFQPPVLKTHNSNTTVTNVIK